MTTKRFILFAVSVVILAALVGCGSLPAQPTATPVPSDTSAPTVTQTPTTLPTQTPLPTPTKVPLADLSLVIQKYAFVPYTGDFTCPAPDCIEYVNKKTGLLMEMFSDGSGFNVLLGWPIENKIALLKNVLTELYPDLATEIMNAIPTKGNSGEVIHGNGSNENYNWDVSGIWFLSIFVKITPR